MLAAHPIDVMLTAPDLSVAKQFYADRIGLDILIDSVEVADYDEPDLKTIAGVADVGFALSAWFVDPGGNTIGLLQFEEKVLG